MVARHRSVVIVAVALVVAGCGAGSPSAAPATPATAAPTPLLTPVPGGQAPVASAILPGGGLDLDEVEAALASGARLDLQATCHAYREKVPAGSIGSVACEPHQNGAAFVIMSAYETQAELLAAYFARLAEQEIEVGSHSGRCMDGPSSEGSYVPGDDPANPNPDRSACWVDADTAPHYLATEPPFVLVWVKGRIGDGMLAPQEFAWLGNQDVPGAPTIWREEPVDAEK